jgi:hypothetical protein
VDWHPVVERTADDGSAAWTLPHDPSSDYRILVTLFDGGQDIGASINAKPFTVDAPVAVTLGGFNAVVDTRGVVLLWDTAFEYEVDGFHLLRSEDKDAGYDRITTEVIPSKGASDGSSYEFVDETARPNRTYYYKLEDVSKGETAEVFGPFEVTYRAAFSLDQNRPNPFNPATRIRFTVPEDGHVSLLIYDVAGRRVRTLVDDRMEANHYEIEWDGRDNQGQIVASGVYFCRLEAGKHSKTKKMLMMK